MAASTKKLSVELKIENEAKNLIRNIVKVKEGSENFKRSLQYVLSNFKYHRYLDVNSHTVETVLKGLNEKFAVHSQEKKAERLQALVNQFLQSLVGRKPGLPKTDIHYAIISVLINLSNNPTKSKLQDVVSTEKKDEEEAFDWTSYLLEGLGPQKSFADDFPSDEEWSEEEGEEPVEEQTEEGENDLKEESVVKEERISLNQLSNELVNPYWTAQNQPLQTSGQKAGYIPHDWITSQERLFPVNTSDVLATSYPVTEDQVVRETLWLLMKPKTTFVYTVNNGNISPNRNLLLSHLTQKCLETMLFEYAAIGTQLLILQSFVDSSFENKEEEELTSAHQLPKCITTQAFAFAIADFLQEFREDVISLEKKCVRQDSVLTLSTVRDALLPWFQQIRLVHQVFTECKRSKESSCGCSVKRVISALEHALSTQLQLCGPKMDGTKTLLVIWMKTMRPYLNFLDHWLTNGDLIDPSEEFSFVRDSNVSVHSNDYWLYSFVTHSNTTKHKVSESATKETASSTSLGKEMPVFLEPLFDQILQAGKGMELLQALGCYVEKFATRQPGSTLFDDFKNATCHLLNHYHQNVDTERENEGETSNDEDEINLPLVAFDETTNVYTSDPLLVEAFSNLLRMDEILKPSEMKEDDISSRLDVPSDAFIPPFKILLHRGLNPLLLDLCSTINKKVLKVLKENYHLPTYLSALRKYFLLEAGDVMYDFYTNIFEDLSDREFYQDSLFENLLNWKLQETLRHRWPDDAERLFIVIESKETLAQGGLFFNSLKLDYKVPWPINILIPPECQEKYNKIFQFLLSVKRVKYSIEQLNFKAHLRIHPHSSVPDRGHQVTTHLSISESFLHQLYLFRFQLLHFVNAIHDYLMTRILHTTSLEFKDALSSAESPDELIAIHRRYLETISERCLLHSKLGMIREAVVKVLSIAVRFHKKWKLGIHSFNSDSLSAMAKEFNYCSVFLSSTLHTVTKKGNFPHLELLSVTIGMHQAPSFDADQTPAQAVK